MHPQPPYARTQLHVRAHPHPHTHPHTHTEEQGPYRYSRAPRVYLHMPRDVRQACYKPRAVFNPALQGQGWAARPRGGAGGWGEGLGGSRCEGEGGGWGWGGALEALVGAMVGRRKSSKAAYPAEDPMVRAPMRPRLPGSARACQNLSQARKPGAPTAWAKPRPGPGRAYHYTGRAIDAKRSSYYASWTISKPGNQCTHPASYLRLCSRAVLGTTGTWQEMRFCASRWHILFTSADDHKSPPRRI
ncbi:hypothetical protein JB92DRAFT_3307147 [Gautieria morchelliformis]|nr:hypothetical protein JB92DRAFT_3307147 [Gautieria morchelliformis]